MIPNLWQHCTNAPLSSPPKGLEHCDQVRLKNGGIESGDEEKYLVDLITVIGVQNVAGRVAAGLGVFIELAAEVLALAVVPGEGAGISGLD